MMNKNLLIVAIIILFAGVGFFVLTKQNSQPFTPVTNSEPQPSPSVITDQKITLIGTVKRLNNNSDPAQYSYELTLNSPFYDKLEYTTGNEYVSKMPILSRDKALQDSIKGYVGKEVAAEGLIEFGLAESRFLNVVAIVDLSSWKTYLNKTYNYNLKFPAIYQISPQTEKQKSQLGIDNNIVVRKLDSSTSVMIIDVYQDKENVSLDDYMNQNSKQLGITGPLLSDRFNGNESLANKNQPGINQFVKQGLYIYHITASTASSDKEVANIVATFKFTK